MGGQSAARHQAPTKKTSPWLWGSALAHTVVYGTTRVGKTRLAELLVTQDIRRGEVTIVFDPKGDADLMKRVWAETHRAGRGDELYIFHLGWPEISGPFSMPSGVWSRVRGGVPRGRSAVG